MSRDQKIRAALFYLSVAVFFSGLPFILSFTLGYTFDPATWKFTRTGLISLRTQPAGAAVFLNGKQRSEKTPCSLNELLPGAYTIELRYQGYYPYSATADVKASSVTRLEKILLFPLRPDVQKVNREQVSWFWVDEDKSVYFVSSDGGSVYKSDLQGEHFEKIAPLVPLSPPARRWKLSPDRKRLLYFSAGQVGISELDPDRRGSLPFVLNTPSGSSIQDACWYSDSYNIIVFNGTQICMYEARPGAGPFVLMKLNSVPRAIHYESEKETIYFQDSQAGADNKVYENVYKLELGRKLYPFGDFMRKQAGVEQ